MPIEDLFDTGLFTTRLEKLEFERFCTVEGDGKELAKLWVWMKNTELENAVPD